MEHFPTKTTFPNNQQEIDIITELIWYWNKLQVYLHCETGINRFNHQNDQDSDASTRLQSGFDEEYQEPNRRVNYNYHPIIDFFKPEASRLQAPEALHSTQPDSTNAHANGNSWKPIVAP